MEKIVILFKIYLSALGSYLIPKKEGLHVYYPKKGSEKFNANIKFLILYSNENHEFENIYIPPSNEAKEEAEEHGIQTVTGFFSVFWAVCRAEHIFLEAASLRFSVGNFSIVQLWHGVGFKDVGVRSRNNDEMRKFLKKHYRNYDLFISTSKEDAKKQNESFVIETAKVTGYPRNDFLIKSSEKQKEDIKRKYKMEQYDEIITYAPTFRDHATKNPFSKSFLSHLESYLRANNSLFLIKKHPLAKYIEVSTDYAHIKDVSKEIDSNQELLLITDLLISDYSSIITDFALTNRPIISYFYDIDEYIENCRNIYYDLEETLPTPQVYDEEELLSHIQSKKWFQQPVVQRRYRKFKRRFHKYTDGNSSKRVMDAVINL